MADVLKTIGLQYVAINPAAGFRSLQESIINYLGNKNPEIITCLHEEIGDAHGAGLRQGGGQADGRHGARHGRAAARLDGHSTTRGCDRVPLMMFAGNGIDADTRRPGVETIHSAQDPAAHGARIRQVGRPARRRCSTSRNPPCAPTSITMTAPMEPVMICLDMDLQEDRDARHARSCAYRR